MMKARAGLRRLDSEWIRWDEHPPDGRASGHIEAVEGDNPSDPAAGDRAVSVVQPWQHIMVDGPKWGHTLPILPGEKYARTHYGTYSHWRWLGPDVPTTEVQGKAIIVWMYQDAPGELAAMSDHGGDEDSSFGCCRVSEHKLPDGRLVKIGAHA